MAGPGVAQRQPGGAPGSCCRTGLVGVGPQAPTWAILIFFTLKEKWHLFFYFVFLRAVLNFVRRQNVPYRNGRLHGSPRGSRPSPGVRARLGRDGGGGGAAAACRERRPRPRARRASAPPGPATTSACPHQNIARNGITAIFGAWRQGEERAGARLYIEQLKTAHPPPISEAENYPENDVSARFRSAGPAVSSRLVKHHCETFRFLRAFAKLATRRRPPLPCRRSRRGRTPSPSHTRPSPPLPRPRGWAPTPPDPDPAPGPDPARPRPRAHAILFVRNENCSVNYTVLGGVGPVCVAAPRALTVAALAIGTATPICACLSFAHGMHRVMEQAGCRHRSVE